MVVPIVLKRMQILKVPCSYFPTYGLKAISFANSENLYIRFWASEQCIPLYKIYTLYMRCIKTNKFPDVGLGGGYSDQLSLVPSAWNAIACALRHSASSRMLISSL